MMDSPRRNPGKFLSTPSARRATLLCLYSPPCYNYFYPRPPRGGRRASAASAGRLKQISIHALREEGDTGASGAVPLISNFYPRPPRGGRPFGAAP